jgi:hypothetical protein
MKIKEAKSRIAGENTLALFTQVEASFLINLSYTFSEKNSRILRASSTRKIMLSVSN